MLRAIETMDFVNEQHVAFLHHITRLHVDAAQVAVHREHALAVVDEHRIAVEEEVPGLNDATRRRIANRRAGRRGRRCEPRPRRRRRRKPRQRHKRKLKS